MRQPVPQTHALEQLAGLLLEDSAALPVAHYRVTNHEGRQDVFEHAQFGEQVIELKDEPEDAVAQFVARTRRQVVDPLIVERDFAHVGAVKSRQQVQERALSRARLSGNRARERARSCTCWGCLTAPTWAKSRSPNRCKSVLFP